METRSSFLRHIRKVVVKVGSNCLTTDSHIDEGKIQKLVEEICSLISRKCEVILVTSGAVAAGAGPLKLAGKKRTVSEKQACAAVGQIILMEQYRKLFQSKGILPAQILLTENDFTDRKRYLNIRNTLDTLLKKGALPIINENDTVAVAEIIFGDNDMLSALIANVADADLLVILTGVEGLLDMRTRERVSFVSRIDDEVYRLITATKSSAGRGGMTSKIQAMKTVMDSGRVGVIASFDMPMVLESVITGKDVGSFFAPARGDRAAVRHSREQWLRYGTVGHGKIIVDAGAVKALQNRKSLLPMGVLAVKGKFDRLDIVDICDESGGRIARGVANYDSASVAKIRKQKSSEIRSVLGFFHGNEVVHVDNLVLLV
jgi:glutamate 5-kinase